jgi:predicted rRNA methylase YqxC with S4 and FtsJ domains
MRLDIFLVKNHFYETRNKSQNAISQRLIQVNGVVIDKLNYSVKENDQVSKLPTEEYVSRGAYKLLAALQK